MTQPTSEIPIQTPSCSYKKIQVKMIYLIAFANFCYCFAKMFDEIKNSRIIDIVIATINGPLFYFSVRLGAHLHAIYESLPNDQKAGFKSFWGLSTHPTNEPTIPDDNPRNSPEPEEDLEEKEIKEERNETLQSEPAFQEPQYTHRPMTISRTQVIVLKAKKK